MTVAAQPNETSAADASLREAFLSAYREAAAGAAPAPAHPALEDYVLFPYLEAARLESSLRTLPPGERAAPDRDAAAFIDTHAGTPLGRRVAVARLESLAQRGLGAELIALYDGAVANAALDCHYLAARIDNGAGDDLTKPILDRWLTAAQLPLHCEPVFEWARNAGIIDADATESRVRLLLENGRTGFGRVIARRLPPTRAAPLNRWAALIEDPATGFDALIADAGSAPDLPAVVDAWTRFARNDPLAALSRIDAVLATLDPGSSAESQLRLALALGLAWSREPAALAQFTRVERDDLDDYALQWLARAALWSSEWASAADAIDALSDSSATDSAWRYWRARTSAELDRPDDAREIYRSMLGDDNFYSALAAVRLDRTATPSQASLDAAPPLLEAIAARLPFQRARELHAVGLEAEARREWIHGYDSLRGDERLASIQLASNWGWHEIAVLTATRNDVFYDYPLLYPRRYTQFVPAAAQRAAFDDNLIFALIRQESLFAADAVSVADAIGLTQIKLETARRAAARWGIESPSRRTLFDPATNITLGAAQMRSLVDDFDGQLLPALAGYNAGYYAAERWLPAEQLDADIWVENIPYNETRAYVRRVLWHSLVYDWLETGRPQDASHWLTPIRRP